jgi:hypothetical protein
METGIELITKERKEQVEKHQQTIKRDVDRNAEGQLSVGAGILAQKTIPDHIKASLIPKHWDERIWAKMINKPYKDRLIIAGALIAAELDRLQATEQV